MSNSLYEENIDACTLGETEKFHHFARFTPRPVVANFLNRYEIFKRVTGIHGSIVEGGVNLGQGLFSWLHFSSILEPYNHSRRVIGFDTFDGFTHVNDKDQGGLYENNQDWVDFRNKQSILELETSIKAHDSQRVLSQIPKVEIVQGDATKTIPSYIEKNPHIIVALMHIDFDVYAPTKAALEYFVPRMPKGAIIAFDEINDPNAPGETLALIESVGLKIGKLERQAFDSNLCFVTID